MTKTKSIKRCLLGMVLGAVFGLAVGGCSGTGQGWTTSANALSAGLCGMNGGTYSAGRCVKPRAVLLLVCECTTDADCRRRCGGSY
jgi:hypothetical protein